MLLGPDRLLYGAQKAHSHKSPPLLADLTLCLLQLVCEVLLLLISSSLAHLSPLIALLGEVGQLVLFFDLFLQLGPICH